MPHWLRTISVFAFGCGMGVLSQGCGFGDMTIDTLSVRLGASIDSIAMPLSYLNDTGGVLGKDGLREARISEGYLSIEARSMGMVPFLMAGAGPVLRWMGSDSRQNLGGEFEMRIDSILPYVSDPRIGEIHARIFAYGGYDRSLRGRILSRIPLDSTAPVGAPIPFELSLWDGSGFFLRVRETLDARR